MFVAWFHYYKFPISCVFLLKAFILSSIAQELYIPFP